MKTNVVLILVVSIMLGAGHKPVQQHTVCLKYINRVQNLSPISYIYDHLIVCPC
jgi:hypothetical protein